MQEEVKYLSSLSYTRVHRRKNISLEWRKKREAGWLASIDEMRVAQSLSCIFCFSGHTGN